MKQGMLEIDTSLEDFKSLQPFSDVSKQAEFF